MMKILLRPNRNAYDAVCMFMKNYLGFELIETGDEKSKSIKSHLKQFIDGLYNILGTTKNIEKIKRAEVVLSIGEYSTLYVMILNKLHIIHPKVILWWGFFIHSKKVQKILKIIFKFMKSSNTKFIVFSEYEKTLYKQSLELSDTDLISIPYGDWNNNSVCLENGSIGNFFFSGGYSNRDYESLLLSWTKYFPEERLVIIGSKKQQRFG